MKVFKRLVAISTAVMLFLLCFSLVGCTHVSKEVQLIVGKWEHLDHTEPFEITSKGEFIVDGEAYEIRYDGQYTFETTGASANQYVTTHSEYPKLILSGGCLGVEFENGDRAKDLWFRVKD